MRYADISRKEQKCQDLTSLTVEEFEKLVPIFEEAFQEYLKTHCLDGKERVGRGYVTYANCPLPTDADRLLFILVYIKSNNLQVIHGELFGMSQGKANQWIHILLPVLQAALNKFGDVPARSVEELAQSLNQNTKPDVSDTTRSDACGMVPDLSVISLDDSEDSHNLPDFLPVVPNESSDTIQQKKDASTDSPLFAHDGTERRIQRPKDDDEQKKHYSGKKKAHTVKNILLVDRDLFIRFLGKTLPGTIHDKRAADATPYSLPEGSHLLQDLGFLGFKLEGVEIEMPIKKPRGGALTEEQKAINQALARRRVAIEHVNSGVKRCRMLKDVCRLLRDGIRDLIMEIGCALHNFRLHLRPWLPIPQPG